MGRIVRSVIRLGDPVMFMGAWGTALLIALFVLYPVFRVLAYPSATDFLAVLDHPRWLRAIVNTLVMTTLSTVTACLLGFVFALALRSEERRVGKEGSFWVGSDFLQSNVEDVHDTG